jgi:hypothetical protein
MKTFLKVVAVVIVMFIGFVFLANIGAEHALKDARTRVAGDFEQQYADAKLYGSAVDRCVRAGLVAEGYLQARDSDNYGKWKAIERTDCEAAGIPQQ